MVEIKGSKIQIIILNLSEEALKIEVSGKCLIE